jgi:hypothetical protein
MGLTWKSLSASGGSITLSLSNHKAELDLTGRFKMHEDLSGSHDLID